MEVFVAVKFMPFEEESIVGIAKTQKGALRILRNKFPHMRGTLEDKNLMSGKNLGYLLDVRKYEVMD